MTYYSIRTNMPVIPCSILHPDAASCLAHNANATYSTFRKTFPLYFSLTFVPFVILHLQKVIFLVSIKICKLCFCYCYRNWYCCKHSLSCYLTFDRSNGYIFPAFFNLVVHLHLVQIMMLVAILWEYSIKDKFEQYSLFLHVRLNTYIRIFRVGWDCLCNKIIYELLKLDLNKKIFIRELFNHHS
jgi:hypothetical protein